MKYCLIGKTLVYSYSAEIHGLRGLDYSLNPIPPENLKAFAESGEYDGFNVTIPYKRDVIPLLSGISEKAREIGAVNTVVKKNGKLFGFNTDADGLKYAITRTGADLKGKAVTILGTGGTSLTAETVARELGAKTVRKVSRNGEINYGNCYSLLKDTQVLINATPVGTYPDIYGKSVDINGFPALTAVFDCVYNPFNTPLVLSAKQKGLIASDGLPMLVAQALYAEEIWGEKPFSVKDCEKIIAEIYRKKGNIALVGMPSCGKSTVGKILAQKLGKKFVDTDEKFTETNGVTPAQCIRERGEKAFRETETAVIREVAKENGLVIATGGGAVTVAENLSALHANGIIVYLKRDLNLLSVKGRPLSAARGVEELYKARKDLYELAEITVENDGDINAVADKCFNAFNGYKFNPPEK